MQRRSPAFYNKRRGRIEQKENRFKTNKAIRAPRLVVIDETGKTLGDLETKEAIRIAEERGFDLVEVQPKANPPIAKLIDYGQFLYEQEKHKQKNKTKQKKVGTKGIRLSIRIGEHDKETRKKQAAKFLEQGNKVKIDIVLRGREKAHTDLGKEIMENFAKSVGEDVIIEQPFTKQGGKISIVIAKKT
jgi:translation initiation factor IF-3